MLSILYGVSQPDTVLDHTSIPWLLLCFHVKNNPQVPWVSSPMTFYYISWACVHGIGSMIQFHQHNRISKHNQMINFYNQVITLRIMKGKTKTWVTTVIKVMNHTWKKGMNGFKGKTGLVGFIDINNQSKMKATKVNCVKIIKILKLIKIITNLENGTIWCLWSFVKTFSTFFYIPQTRIHTCNQLMYGYAKMPLIGCPK